jgi:integrase
MQACKASKKERSTFNSYERLFRLHINPRLGTKKLAALTVPMICDFEECLLRGDPTGPGDEGVPRSIDLVGRCVKTLAAAIAQAQRKGLVTQNVARDLTSNYPRGTREHGEKRQKPKLQIGLDIPSPDEIRAVLAALAKMPDGQQLPVMLVFTFQGLRCSELLGLCWSAVDLEKGKLHVRQRADQYKAIGMPKTAASQRTIPLTPKSVSALRHWRTICPKSELDLVFPTADGDVQSHDSLIKHVLFPVMIAAGVTKTKIDRRGNVIVVAKYTGLHRLRHFFASWCINSKEDGGLDWPQKSCRRDLAIQTSA